MSERGWRAAVVAAAILATAASGRASANVAAPDVKEARVAEPAPIAKSKLVVLMTIVPSFELVTPAFFILPTLGFGVGAPVQVQPDARAGVRIEASLFFFPVGLATAVDVFPKPDPVRDPNVVRLNLLAQFGM